VKALILAGGFGTRLRPLTNHTPKSLLPICNRPFLEHQIRLLARHGVDRATLLTGYLAEDFGPFADQMHALLGVELEISTETQPLDTAGAVRSKLDELDGTTIVFNGDVLTDVDLSAIIQTHGKNEAVLTLYLTHVDDARPYGLVPLDDDDRVTAFLEKPPDLVSGDINAGIYVLEPSVLADIPPDTPWSFERQLFPSLLEQGAPVFGAVTDAYWLDIGNPQRYLQAHHDVLAGRVRAEIDGQLFTETKELSDGTRIIGPSLLSHAPVGAGAQIGPLTTLARGCAVGAGAVVERSVLHTGAVVGNGAIVRDSILGAGVVIEAGQTLDGEILAP
jgi:mannose-1-phosphate guanylyltransferase